MNSYFSKSLNKNLLKLKDLPIALLTAITLLILIGLMMLYSASGGNFHPWAIKQLTYSLVFLPMMIIISIIELKFWYRFAYLFYLISLLLLILIELYGHTAMGATRWINFKLFKLQPSELMKICLILALARYFHNLERNKINNIKYLAIPLIMIIIPASLIIKQPDLGTGLILLLIGAIVFFAVEVKIWKFVVVLSVIMLSLPLAWQFLHDYQKNRILIFIEPERDPLGRGYNIIQSKIAIGAGGLSGRGLLRGSQSQLDFLPEHQTDFIFTMIAEELGFTKAVIILVLYIMIIIIGIKISVNCKNYFGKLLALGITSLMFLHVFINIAMIMGLLPVVGVPLPLLSYGGTMIMNILFGYGLIINVYIHSTRVISNNKINIF